MWNFDLSACQIWCVRSRIIEIFEFDISRSDNLKIRDTVPLNSFPTENVIPKNLPLRKYFLSWLNTMLGIGNGTSMQAPHSAAN